MLMRAADRSFAAEKHARLASCFSLTSSYPTQLETIGFTDEAGLVRRTAIRALRKQRAVKKQLNTMGGVFGYGVTGSDISPNNLESKQSRSCGT